MIHALIEHFFPIWGLHASAHTTTTGSRQSPFFTKSFKTQFTVNLGCTLTTSIWIFFRKLARVATMTCNSRYVATPCPYTRFRREALRRIGLQRVTKDRNSISTDLQHLSLSESYQTSCGKHTSLAAAVMSCDECSSGQRNGNRPKARPFDCENISRQRRRGRVFTGTKEREVPQSCQLTGNKIRKGCTSQTLNSWNRRLLKLLSASWSQNTNHLYSTCCSSSKQKQQ